jgi:hypothetical protein
MKKINIIAMAAVALGLAFNCQAQFKASSVALAAGTNLAATTAYTPASGLLDVRMYDTVSVNCRVVLAGAGTGNIVFRLVPGMSTTEFAMSNVVYALSFPAYGTSTNYAITNIDVGGFAYLKILDMSNSTAAAASLIRLQVGQKTYLYNSSKP